MGLFNKLKNALFEEEEIEIPIKEVPESKPISVIKEEKVENKPEPIKKNIEKILEEENERDLFKAENTFKFPDFDEEEFQTSYKPPIEKEEKVEPVITPKENTTRIKTITFDYDKKPKQTRKEAKKEIVEETKEKKTFKPSPVISPVYGVLDKNYRKEDIITVKEEKPKRVFDVDAVRKKAFGTLEDDIERSLEEPKETFYRNSDKSIEDLLSDSTDEKIDITYESPRNTRESRNGKRSRVIVEQPIEETIPESRRERRLQEEEMVEETPHYNEVEKEVNSTNDLQVLDEESSKSEEQHFEEDTLENDLFDLIDSMYDNREEEEE